MLNHHICHSICLFLVAMGPIAKGDSDLNIGIYEKAFTAADPGDIMIVINNLLDQVELVGKKAKATRYRSREAFLTALKSGDVDIAPLESYQYLDISNEVPLDPIAAPVITGNNASQQFILLANKEISFSDVVGSMSQRSIALDKRWSSSFAEDWLNKHLSDHGASVSDFKKLVVVEKPSQAVLPVFFKKRDLGVTTANSFALMTELNPQLQQQLHVIATSPPLVLFMLCAPETVDQRTRAEITEQLLTLHRQKVGHQILLLSKASSMARVTASQLATIKALAESSKAGKANDQHKQLTQREDIEQ